MLQVYFKVKANVETHKNIEWYLGSETMAPHHQFRKRKLVLAEDCAGLGSLHESCRLLGPINISNFDCELDCDLLLTKVIPSTIPGGVLRLAGLKGSLYYVSESNEKLLNRLTTIHKPELVSKDATKPKGYSI